MENVAFGVIAATMAVAAVGVVTMRSIVHCALSLVVVLAGVAAQYVLLHAEFLGLVQVLIYIGAVIILFLFGIMLTRAPMAKSNDLDNNQRWPALIVGGVILAVLVALVSDTFDGVRITTDIATPTSAVADSIFRTYVVAFEVISVLLLAALIGAIVIARKD